MEIIVDGERNFSLQGEAEDLLAVVAAIGQFLQSSGRTIMSIRLDGQDLSPEQVPTSCESVPLSSIQVLEVGSEAIGPMVRRCLGEIATHLDDLPEICRELAQVFQGETPREGYAPFQQLAEIWSVIKDRQRLVASILNVGLDTPAAGGLSLKTMHDELNRYLEEAAEALEKEDCVLLGDLLEYELAPRAEQEGAIIALLQERADEADT